MIAIFQLSVARTASMIDSELFLTLVLINILNRLMTYARELLYCAFYVMIFR